MEEVQDVRSAQAGDMAAAERLLLARLPEILRLLQRLLPSRDDAEDVAQEVCLHALVGLTSLQRPDLFGAWLRTIAYNRAMQWQRRRYAEASAWPRLWQPEADDGAEPGAVAQADTQAALGLLSPADRDAVVLRYFEGWTSAEIGERQGVPAGTVRWRLHRSMATLRAALSEETGNKE